MDAESLYTATKWDILKALEKQPQSPLELSEVLHSSLANVSQQLRLLELAGIVTSAKVGNRDKGQPRVRYQLAGDFSYLIATSDNFVEKRNVKLSERNKVVLKIWFLDDAQVRYALEKAFWQIEEHLAQMTTLAYKGLESGRPVLEYSGTAKLPRTLTVGGDFSTITLQHSAAPQGYVLYARK